MGWNYRNEYVEWLRHLRLSRRYDVIVYVPASVNAAVCASQMSPYSPHSVTSQKTDNSTFTDVEKLT
jgi:hypothetical protein